MTISPFISPKPDVVSVKTSLKSIIKPYNKNFYDKITELVIRCNDITILTYQFIRLFCLYKYSHDDVIPKINQKFVFQVIRTLGIKSNKGRKVKDTSLKTEFEQFYYKEFQPLIPNKKIDIQNLSHAFEYMSRQIVTNINVNIQEHFTTRLLRFVDRVAGAYYDDKGGEPDKKFSRLRRLKKALFTGNESILPKIFRKWYHRYRNKILPTDYEKSIAYDLKKSPTRYLKYSFFLNERLEEEGHKLFQSLPLRSNIVPKYITIDTALLVDLFGKKGTKQKLKEHIIDNQYEIWNEQFRMEKKVFKRKGYRFDYLLQTDGIGASLIFVNSSYKKKYDSGKNVKTKKNRQEFYYIDELDDGILEKLKSKKIVGVDPGKQSMVYMADVYRNKLRYTIPQRSVESKSKRNGRITLMERKKAKVVELESKLSEFNSKTSDYERFKDYIKAKNELNSKVKQFYIQTLFRKLRWREKVYSRKSEDRFINNVQTTFGSDIVLAYGNWSRKTQMRYCMPTMGIGLRRLLAKKFITVTIDEHNTSRRCCNCNSEIKKYRGKLRLLVCKGCVSTECKETVFYTRDLNSAINMMRIAICWIEKRKRPRAFRYKNNFCPILGRPEEATRREKWDY